MKLLREAFRLRSQNVRLARKIENEKSLAGISAYPVQTVERMGFKQKWWLASLFDKHGIPFGYGAILIYLAKDAPTMLLLPFLAGRIDPNLLSAYISSILGGLYVPLTFILLLSIYKSFVSLTETINLNLRENQYVAPSYLLSQEVMEQRDKLEKLDKDFSDKYIKPFALKTLQSGLDLMFNWKYQIVSGLIGAGLYWTILFGAHLTITNLGVPPLEFFNALQATYNIGLDWFTIGFTAWTLFMGFICIIQVAGDPLRTRPYELIREKFSFISSTMLRISITVTFVVAWAGPFLLLWSVLPPDPAGREATLRFVEIVLAVMIPTIVLSFMLPTLKIHRGMMETRKRLLLLKAFQLDTLKISKKSSTKEYREIQRHLIQDYKDIQRNSTWLFSQHQVLQMFGSILLPVVTFWLSIAVR